MLSELSSARLETIEHLNNHNRLPFVRTHYSISMKPNLLLGLRIYIRSLNNARQHIKTIESGVKKQ